jgi:hypothetical protein
MITLNNYVRPKRSPIELLRSMLALLLIRIANRLYSQWFYAMNLTEQQWAFSLHDPFHDYEPQMIEDRAVYIVEDVARCMDMDTQARNWIAQRYEAYHRNPITNLRWLFRGLTRHWLDVDKEK